MYSPGSGAGAGAGLYSPVYSCRSGSLVSERDASIYSSATAFGSPSAYLDSPPFRGPGGPEGALAGALEGLGFGCEDGEAFMAGAYSPPRAGKPEKQQLVLDEVCSALAGCNADTSVLDSVDPGVFLRCARPHPARPAAARPPPGLRARRGSTGQSERVMAYLKALMDELERGGGLGAQAVPEAPRARRHGRQGRRSCGEELACQSVGQSPLTGPARGDGESMDGLALDRILAGGQRGPGAPEGGLGLACQSAAMVGQSAGMVGQSAAGRMMACCEDRGAYPDGYYDLGAALAGAPAGTQGPCAEFPPPQPAVSGSTAWSTDALTMAAGGWEAAASLGLLPGAYSHCRGAPVGMDPGAHGLTHGAADAGQSAPDPGVRAGANDLLFGLPEGLPQMCG
ncbi:unnamed protein product [Ostreobium quekettii]|uniref:Uncharacterized protein n=1 Tax=Ostreobium quekettii TaxID=121088 RepID=A0A8S1IMW1_9CHLO|nr:unnamed protein product [Ostreobium quekettii]